VLRQERRATYLEVPEAALGQHDIESFSKFVAEELAATKEHCPCCRCPPLLFMFPVVEAMVAARLDGG